MLYWDTSALVKQYIIEQGTDSIQQWQAESAATSLIAFTEVHSAVMRRRRDGTLSESIARSILRAFRKEAQRRFVWVNCPHFRGKKAVRILSRRYSSSR